MTSEISAADIIFEVRALSANVVEDIDALLALVRALSEAAGPESDITTAVEWIEGTREGFRVLRDQNYPGSSLQ